MADMAMGFDREAGWVLVRETDNWAERCLRASWTMGLAGMLMRMRNVGGRGEKRRDEGGEWSWR
jgi:hypothetical protein